MAATGQFLMSLDSGGRLAPRVPASNNSRTAPYCATGEIFRNPVHVLFSGSTSASGDSHCPTTFRYYTQMIVAYPDRAEIPFPVPTPDQTSDPKVLTAVVTKYNNMPAVRWYNLQIICNSPNI
jgi:hypothetical protein